MGPTAGKKVPSTHLPSGGRVGIIGPGLGGLIFASALLHAARIRGRALEVVVFGRTGDSPRRPVVLTPECRQRLASLGCRGHLEWRPSLMEGVEIFSHGARGLFQTAGAETWIMGPGPGGTDSICRALRELLVRQGVSFRPWDVQGVEQARDQPSTRGRGNLMLVAAGRAERFHAVVLASGQQSILGDRLFPGYQPPPSFPAVLGVVEHDRSALLRSSGTIRLVIDPTEGLDGLYLIPSRGGLTYALGFGRGANARTLCRALVEGSRMGLLPGALNVVQLRATRLGAGRGKKLVADGRLAVGNAAAGHPLQLALSDLMSGCTRACISLLEGSLLQPELQRRYAEEGIPDLLEDATVATKAMGWLRRAGEYAPRAVELARARSSPQASYLSGVWGLCAPSPRGLLSSARRAGIRHRLRSIFLQPVVSDRLGAVEPKLIYVVDDDPDVRAALTSFLEARGCQVMAFASELALFEATSHRQPAAIVLDVVLPWVDGLQLCRGLKRHPLTRSARVIVTSGLDLPNVRLQALKSGAEAFLPKPLQLDRLWQALRGLSDEAPALAQGAHTAAS